MATDVRVELHGLIDQLPEDTLGKIKDIVVEELRLRSAVIAAAQARGLSVEETRVTSGTVFKLNRSDDPDPILRALEEAPVEDELLSDEEIAAMTAAVDRHERGTGRSVSSEELLRRIGG